MNFPVYHTASFDLISIPIFYSTLCEIHDNEKLAKLQKIYDGPENFDFLLGIKIL